MAKGVVVFGLGRDRGLRGKRATLGVGEVGVSLRGGSELPGLVVLLARHCGLGSGQLVARCREFAGCIVLAVGACGGADRRISGPDLGGRRRQAGASGQQDEQTGGGSGTMDFSAR